MGASCSACGEKEEGEERTNFDRDSFKQEKRDNVTDSTKMGRPFVDMTPQTVAC